VFDLAQASVTGRRTRIPELALGVLLVAGCALAAVAWQTLSDPSRAVLAVRNDIDRGDIITAADLQAVEIATDDQVNLIPSGRAESMVGRIAQVDLVAGTLLTTAMAADVAAIGDGQALVGLAVERGSLPSSSLRPGSRVDVVLTPADDDDASLLSTDGAVLVAGAEVSEATGTATGNDRTVYVSLLVTQDDAVKLARAAAHERVHLIEVPEAGR
jgi:hypothetical protein